MTVRTDQPSIRIEQEPYAARLATSTAGTPIAYREVGRGPGVVVVHGTMSSAHNHTELAAQLSDSFTVYSMDRRGRGQSGPYPSGYSIATELADLAAVLTQTGARDVFGVSSGGIIALQAALAMPEIRKVAVYEPPFFTDRSRPAELLERFDEELSEGRVAAALITAMRGAQMGPPIFNAMPRWLTERLTNLMLSQEDRKGSGDYVPMRALAPTLHYDFQLVVDMSGALERFAAIQADVLLLGGSKSPAYLKAALDDLQRILPHHTRVELPGLDHAASWNEDRGGRPEAVARALRAFLA
jgi:pimeloyl-ACP methyl ester carboxylesterase